MYNPQLTRLIRSFGYCSLLVRTSDFLFQALEKVLQKLDPLDLLDSALVCRRWKETVSSSPSLFREIWLTLRGGTMERVVPMILKSELSTDSRSYVDWRE